MWYLLTSLWLPALLSLCLGLLIGLATNRGGSGRWLSGWVPLGLALFVVGLVVALFRWLPGRAGLWLDVALLLFAAYIIGCFLGALLRGWLVDDTRAAGTAQSGASSGVSAGTATASVGLAGTGATKPAAAAPVTSSSASDLDGLPGMTPQLREKLAGLGIHDRARLSTLDPDERGWLLQRIGKTGDWQSAGWWPAAPAAMAVRPAVAAVAAESPIVVSPAPLAAGAVVVDAPAAPAAPVLVGGVDVSALSGERPASLAAPRANKADDLKRIRGIGPQNEGRLHGLGIWHFDQIAAWTDEQVKWVGGYLAFPGRIERENWVSQAAVLASGAQTEFSIRAARGEVATSKDDGSAGQGNIETPVPNKPR